MGANDPLHESEKAEAERRKWATLWSPNKLPDANAIDRFLQWAPRDGFKAPGWKITGKQVRATIAKDTAAGTDQWSAKLWRCLPEHFFEVLAGFWNKLVEMRAPLPNSWRHQRASLIPKPGSADYRPLSVAVLAWRACSSATVKNLSPWVERWAHKCLYGGIPRRVADELHERLQSDLLQAVMDKGNGRWAC